MWEPRGVFDLGREPSEVPPLCLGTDAVSRGPCFSRLSLYISALEVRELELWGLAAVSPDFLSRLASRVHRAVRLLSQRHERLCVDAVAEGL